MATHLSVLARNVELDALASLFDFAIMRIFTGLQPQSIGMPETGLLLAQLQFNQPAFSPAQGGIIVATNILPDPAAANDGQAGWVRIYHADGITPIMDGACGCSAQGIPGEIDLVSIFILKGSIVACHALRIGTPE